MSNSIYQKNYHYIIGIGRSGTTLLSKLLNNHKSCLVTLETDFVIFFYNSFYNKTSFTNQDFNLICKYFDLYFEMNPTVIDYFNSKTLHDDLKKSNFTSFQELIEFIYLRFNFLNKPINDIKTIIDKKPSYTLHVDDLLKLNTNSLFIYLIRDYRANILSRKQSVERRNPNTAFNAYRWLFFNKKMSKFLLKYPSKILTVKYENLATNTSLEMSSMYEFLGLSTTENDITFYSNEKLKPINKSAHIERVKKTHSDLEKPIFTDRIEAWKTELTSSEIEICECICGDFAETLGYKKTKHISFIKKSIITLKYFSQYIKASYDYRKEFLLFYVSPNIKLSRIQSKYDKK